MRHTFLFLPFYGFSSPSYLHFPQSKTTLSIQTLDFQVALDSTEAVTHQCEPNIDLAWKRIAPISSFPETFLLARLDSNASGIVWLEAFANRGVHC